jgi:excisionase family DNA binding protein
MVNDNRFLHIDELAREARVSKSTVRHWCRIGRLSSTRLGKHRVITRESFERMIAEGFATSANATTPA